jgi:uncharacterized protein YbbC (DUF1343 family)
MKSNIAFGIDQFLKEKQARHKRWGLVTNDVVMNSNLIPVRKALISTGFNIVRLFSPEHGIEAMGKDGESITHRKDRLTGLPIYSLYGDTLTPPPSVLKDLDGVLFDLPDIGVRFYTYIWTLSYIMEACEAANVPLVILDRPNPISGNLNLAEGPLLDESTASSFIGRWRIPIRHSLTVGELATFWKSERGFSNLDLQIFTAKNWKRHQFIQDLQLPFVPTSPAISSIETLLTYPALCFLEGMNVSEGRGTAFPFRICGAPFMDGIDLADAFNALNLQGIKARPFSFTPSEGWIQGQICKGIMLHVVDYTFFRPVETGFHLVALLKKLYPNQIKWANYPTNANKTGERHFDLLTGTPSVKIALENDLDSFLGKITRFTQIDNWLDKTSTYHLYL